MLLFSSLSNGSSCIPFPSQDIIHSGEQMRVSDSARDRLPERRVCARCGYISSMEVCKACVMLEGLNRGLPRLGVGKSSATLKAFGRLKITGDEEDEQKEEKKVVEKKSIDF